MSLADLERYESSGGPSEELGRTPPQDVAAEMSVLGGMMLSKDAIADVVEQIRGTDFYRPAHELVYDAIMDLYGRGEPADAVTVAATLTRKGEIGRVGGQGYLHTLISSVPTAANAGYYARIVRERAVLRRLVEAGTKIVQLGYAADGGDVDALVNTAQAEIYAVTEQRTTEDYVPLGSTIEATIDEIEASSHRGDGMIGVPTGFADLDALTNGLHPGQMIVIAARPAIGKALALDTPLPTPTGWTTMGEVSVGDLVVAADGTPTRVVAATEVMVDRPCYEVVFDDGTTVVADAQHQWVVSGRQGVLTTEQLAADLADGAPVAVPLTEPLAGPAVPIDVDPYRAGALWAAQGCPLPLQVSALVEADGPDAPVTDDALEVLVSRLLRGSAVQRSALFAGAADVWGAPGASGEVLLAFSGERAVLVAELATSLGARVAAVPGSGSLVVDGGEAGFRRSDLVLERKRARGGADAAVHRLVLSVQPVESVPVRCIEVEHPSHLYLATRSMVPTHNSTIGLDILRSASIKHGMTSVVFSLEMGKTEITMRLLSAEARIPLQNMRKGTMREEDWTRLAKTMGAVSEAPLFIDDSPNMTLMEIRAKCRRLKQRHDLRLVVIDYLQLMTSGKRVESRQQEVSEFSRALKLLAKELQVPVIAISQLNRGAEQRSDKKPAMSDLRESGCLTADARLMRADTGAEVSLGELIANKDRDIPVWALNERLQLVPRTMTHAFSSGVKEAFRMRLASGREITATANHPFLTFDGWKPLGELSPGNRLGVVRHVPPPLSITAWDDDEVVLLAHMIGDGSMVARQPIRYASIDEANLTAVQEAAARRFGITGIRDEYPEARVTTLRLPAPYRLARGKRNPIAAWLDGLGLFDKRSHEKFVPDGVFGLPKAQVALFLRHLWATDGCLYWYEKYGFARIYYASTSRRLADDVCRLLARFNIMARVSTTTKAGYRDCYQVMIYGSADQRRFLEQIGVHGARGLIAAELQKHLEPIASRVRRDLSADGRKQLRLAMLQGQGTEPVHISQVVGTKTPLSSVVEALDEEDLDIVATNDVLWDEVKSITSVGEVAVYDATVMGLHNFVANGVNAKNSIEQDADMVILLHREDAYERESPRAGEADLIIAKHRNGPTDTLVVAFQGHYSRFVDMAAG